MIIETSIKRLLSDDKLIRIGQINGYVHALIDVSESLIKANKLKEAEEITNFAESICFKYKKGGNDEL